VDLKNTDILSMGPGDVLHVTCGGAGGWGDPLKRDPAAVLLDYRRGWVSPEHARNRYGVVILDGAVADMATQALRAEIAKTGDAPGFYDLGPYREAFEAIWTEDNYDALTDCLASLPVHWRFYAKHRIFDAIDALDDASRAGDGSEVRSAFASMVAEFPQLNPHAAE
jgi:N-methylhydantoinase B